MKAVLDSCVALKWVLAEADSAKALDLRAQFQEQLHELLALTSSLRNALMLL